MLKHRKWRRRVWCSLAHLSQKINAMLYTVYPAPPCLHLQMSLAEILNDNNQCYEVEVSLSGMSREELNWWGKQTSKCNGRSMLKKEIDFTQTFSSWGCARTRELAGSMVPGGAEDSHTLSWTAHTHSSSANIWQEQNYTVCTLENRQYYGSSVHKQFVEQNIERPCHSYEDVVRHSHHSPAPIRHPELNCWHKVSFSERLIRQEAKPIGLPKNKEVIWSLESGSICFQVHNSVPSLFQLAARSICSSHRYISEELVHDKRLCKPSMVSSGTGSQVQTSSCSTNWHCSGTPSHGTKSCWVYW